MPSTIINLKQITSYFNILFFLKNSNWFKYFNPKLVFNSFYFQSVFKKNLLTNLKCFKKQNLLNFQKLRRKNVLFKKELVLKHKYQILPKLFFYSFSLLKPSFKKIGPLFTKKTFCYISGKGNNKFVKNNQIRNVRKRFFYKFKTLKLQFFIKSILKHKEPKNFKIFSTNKKLKLKKTLKPGNNKPYLYIQKKQKFNIETPSLFQNFLTKTKNFYNTVYNKKKRLTHTETLFNNLLTKQERKKNKIIGY